MAGVAAAAATKAQHMLAFASDCVRQTLLSTMCIQLTLQHHAVLVHLGS
jgi:hypothetical protein